MYARSPSHTHTSGAAGMIACTHQCFTHNRIQTPRATKSTEVSDGSTVLLVPRCFTSAAQNKACMLQMGVQEYSRLRFLPATGKEILTCVQIGFSPTCRCVQDENATLWTGVMSASALTSASRETASATSMMAKKLTDIMIATIPHFRIHGILRVGSGRCDSRPSTPKLPSCELSR